jgi:hypothetical protein
MEDGTLNTTDTKTSMEVKSKPDSELRKVNIIVSLFACDTSQTKHSSWKEGEDPMKHVKSSVVEVKTKDGTQLPVNGDLNSL